MSLFEMQKDLAEMRQAVAETTAILKRTELEYEEANSKANQWHSRAELALREGNEDLARKELEKRFPSVKLEKNPKKFWKRKHMN
jgi:phage shock protein A, PspA